MKGYLQRMAATAIKPAQSVQPALGTVFTGARSGPEAESTPDVWAELTMPIEAAPEAPQTTQKSERAARPTPHAEADPSTSPIGEIAAPASHTIRPQGQLSDRAFFEPLIQEPAVSQAKDPLTRPAPAYEPAGNPAWSTRVETESTTETRPETQVRIIARPPALPISQTREHRAQRSAPAKADEVHIHIGRIEVTAVPPAAPPAIRKPARKSPTLEEYLRRSR